MVSCPSGLTDRSTSERTVSQRPREVEARAAVVDEFYDRVVADDEHAEYVEDTDGDPLWEHQTQLLASATGRPVD